MSGFAVASASSQVAQWALQDAIDLVLGCAAVRDPAVRDEIGEAVERELAETAAAKQQWEAEREVKGGRKSHAEAYLRLTARRFAAREIERKLRALD